MRASELIERLAGSIRTHGDRETSLVTYTDENNSWDGGDETGISVLFYNYRSGKIELHGEEE